MFALQLCIIIIGVIGIWYLAQFVMVQLAKRKTLWRVREEGYATAITKNGEFYEMKLAFTGKKFKGTLPAEAHGKDEETDNLDIYEIMHDSNDKAIRGFKNRLLDILLPARGLIWVGFPEFYDVYKYKFEWMDDKYNQRDPEILDKVKVTPYVYGMVFKNMELEGGIPFDIRFLITSQVTNPAKALFRITRYVDAMLETVRGLARNEFSLKLSYNDFVTQTSDPGSTTVPSTKLADAIDRMVTAVNTVTKDFGVTVHGIKVDIDPASDKLREITLQKEEAKQAGLAAIEKAKLQADALKEEATGQARALDIATKAKAKALLTLNKAAKTLDDKTLHLKDLEAIEGSDLTLINGLNLPTTATLPIKKGN